MSTDEFDAVKAAFPGSEFIEVPGSETAAVRATQVEELVVATEAMVEWFRANEPARLERAGWRRIMVAIEVIRGR